MSRKLPLFLVERVERVDRVERLRLIPEESRPTDPPMQKSTEAKEKQTKVDQAKAINLVPMWLDEGVANQ